jgi:hypothetical protein
MAVSGRAGHPGRHRMSYETRTVCYGDTFVGRVSLSGGGGGHLALRWRSKPALWYICETGPGRRYWKHFLRGGRRYWKHFLRGGRRYLKHFLRGDSGDRFEVRHHAVPVNVSLRSCEVHEGILSVQLAPVAQPEPAGQHWLTGLSAPTWRCYGGHPGWQRVPDSLLVRQRLTSSGPRQRHAFPLADQF